MKDLTFQAGIMHSDDMKAVITNNEFSEKKLKKGAAVGVLSTFEVMPEAEVAETLKQEFHWAIDEPRIKIKLSGR